MCSVLNTMSKRISGKFCVAAGCTSTNRDNVSLHEFPKEEMRPEIRRLWITFVKTKRKDFTNPTKYSVLCEKHFAPKCYPQEYLIKESMGFEVKRKILLPDAIPTVHTVDVSCPEKRPNPYASPSHQAASERPSQPKKMRAAFRKRECMRVLQPESSASVKNNESVETGADSCNDLDKSEQSKTRTVGMQVNRKPVFKRSKYSQVKPQLKEKGVQVDIRQRPKMISAGTQCNRDLEEFELSRKRKKPKLTQRSYMIDDVDYTAPIYTDERNKDSDYEPNLSDDSLSDTYSEENSQSEGTGVWNERKFIVFESNLLELFRYCSSCSSVTLFAVKKILGSLVQVEQICGSCGHHRIWNSQPMTGSIPSGNLLLSAAILFTGLLPSKALRFLEHLHIQTITANTFFQHQKHYLHPSVCNVWKNFQDNYFRKLAESDRALTVGGDGRADTPGHSAKFGSYALLDMDLSLVINIELVQSNEVKSSYHMEKEGFIRSTNHIQERGIKIKEIITDRHVQIVKHIREEMPETVHHFDVWHVAKGLKKKLTAMSKEKGCEQLQEWIRSICNHLYWSAASTPDGNGRLMLEKWQSVANHVQNIHEHDGELYDTCPHGPLEGIERRKKWLIPGSKVAEKFSDLVFSNQMKKDVPKLSPGSQTAALEGFHAVVNHFAPKMIGFSYHGMLSRLILAALHFNENGMREQATTKDGKKRFDIVFPKFKRGEYTVREVKVECTYDYVKKLMSSVEERASQFSMNSSVVVQRQPAPPPLCSVYHHPDKTKAVEEKLSRFNQQHFGDDDSSACC